MSFKTIRLIFFMLSLIFTGNCYAEDYDFIISCEIASLDASSLRKDPRVYPWNELTGEEKKQGVFLVPSGCGLISYVYKGIELEQFSQLDNAEEKKSIQL